MRIVFLLFLILYIQFPLFSQKFQEYEKDRITNKKVSLVARGVPLGQVLTYLSKNHNINFSYSENIISTEKIVYVSLHKQSLEIALQKILLGTTVSYKIVGENIVLINNKKLNPQFKQIKDSVYKVEKQSQFGGYVRDYYFNDRFKPKSKLEKEYLKYQRKYYLSLKKNKSHSDSTTSNRKDTIPARKKNLKSYLDKESGSMQLELSYMPINGLRKVTAEGDEGQKIAFSKENFEKRSPSYTTSILLHRHLLKNFRIGSGISYLKLKRYTTNQKYIETVDPQNHKIWFLEKQSQNLERWNYVGIPFILGAQLGIKRFSFTLDVVFTAQFLLNHRQKLISNKEVLIPSDHPKGKFQDGLVESVEVKNDFKELNSMFSVDANVSYNIWKIVDIYLGPYYYSFLNSIYTSKIPVKDKPYGIGAVVGVRMRL